MDWQTFWQNLRNQALDAQQGDSLLEQLASFDQPLDAFWYPGSGDDLTPLMLDVPNNPAGRRLLRLNGKPQSNPVLFWMNDYSEDYQHFPGDDLLGRHWKSCYPELWEEYQARAVFGRQRERYRLNQDIVITLFTVTVYNQDQGAHDRDAGGDEYLVCFAHCTSEQFLEQVIGPLNIHLWAVALIRQGGCSGQLGRGHYFGLPMDIGSVVVKQAVYRARIAGKVNEQGRIPREDWHKERVDYWLIDHQGQDKNGQPECFVELSDYQQVGGPLPWGWPPMRIYAKPGTVYTREPRPERRGISWRNRYW